MSADDTERKHEPNGCRSGGILGAAVIASCGVVLLNEGAEGMAEALAYTTLQISSLPKFRHLFEFATLFCIVRRFVADVTGML